MLRAAVSDVFSRFNVYGWARLRLSERDAWLERDDPVPMVGALHQVTDDLGIGQHASPRARQRPFAMALRRRAFPGGLVTVVDARPDLAMAAAVGGPGAIVDPAWLHWLPLRRWWSDLGRHVEAGYTRPELTHGLDDGWSRILSERPPSAPPQSLPALYAMDPTPLVPRMRIHRLILDLRHPEARALALDHFEAMLDLFGADGVLMPLKGFYSHDAADPDWVAQRGGPLSSGLYGAGEWERAISELVVEAGVRRIPIVAAPRPSHPTDPLQGLDAAAQAALAGVIGQYVPA